MVAHADILPTNNLTFVDGGCAAGLGQFQLEENESFGEIRCANKLFTPIERFATEKLTMAALSRYLASNGGNVSFDRLPNIDWPWIEASRHYPADFREEVINCLRIQEEHYRARGHLRVVQGDFVGGGNLGGLTKVRSLSPDGKWDVAMAVTSLYEVPKTDINEALLSVESLARHLVIVQDTAEIDETDPTKLIFADDIYAPSARYRLFSKVVSKPGQPYVQLGTFKDFRCGEMEAEPYLIDRLLRHEKSWQAAA